MTASAPEQPPTRATTRESAIALGGAVIVGIVLGGGVVGGGVRWAATAASPEERASAAVIATLALAVCVTPALPGVGLLRVVRAVLAGGAAAAAAVLVAGGTGAIGAAAVVAGAAGLATGAAGLARSCSDNTSGSVLFGALVPLVLGALVFVADPWIEWRGSGPASPARAALIYRLSPIAAVTSPEGGTGVDWQTRSLLYDGGDQGGRGGLSVIGQFYPARPASPYAWGGAALLVGALLAGVGAWLRTRRGPGCPATLSVGP